MASLNPYTGVLGSKLAAHLLRRATYRPTKDNIETFAALTPQDAVAQLLTLSPLDVPAPYDPETQQPWINSGVPPVTGDFFLTYYLLGWWCDEARKNQSIGHKLEHFLHTVFPCDSNDTSTFVFDHMALIRFYAQSGNLKTLARKMILDNRMLLYLDNTLNSAGAVNENFSREYLELHTIQKGEEDGPGSYTTYTELDVQVAARLLTGWRKNWNRDNIDADTGLAHGYASTGNHDSDDKTFSDKFQSQTIVGGGDFANMSRELDEFVDMIYRQEASARSFVRRMYRFFVSANITAEVETDIIGPLAADLQYADPNHADHYNMHVVLRRLLESQHFYDKDDASEGDNIIGAIIKSPVDMFISILSTFDIAPPHPTGAGQADLVTHYRSFYYNHLARSLAYAGIDFYEPETVAGYPGYHQEPGMSRNWFSTSSIIGRFRFPEMILENRYINDNGSLGGNTNVPFNIAEFIRDTNFITDPRNGHILVDEFLENVLVEFPDDARRDHFRDILLDGLSLINWQIEWDNYINNGNDSAVIIPLKNLFTAVLYSEEYQMQ